MGNQHSHIHNQYTSSYVIDNINNMNNNYNTKTVNNCETYCNNYDNALNNTEEQHYYIVSSVNRNHINNE